MRSSGVCMAIRLYGQVFTCWGVSMLICFYAQVDTYVLMCWYGQVFIWSGVYMVSCSYVQVFLSSCVYMLRYWYGQVFIWTVVYTVWSGVIWSCVYMVRCVVWSGVYMVILAPPFEVLGWLHSPLIFLVTGAISSPSAEWGSQILGCYCVHNNSWQGGPIPYPCGGSPQDVPPPLVAIFCIWLPVFQDLCLRFCFWGSIFVVL